MSRGGVDVEAPAGLDGQVLEEAQPEVALLPAPVERISGEAAPVVGHDQPREAVVPADLHVDPPGLRVHEHVSKRLLGRAEHLGLRGVREPEVVVDREARRKALAFERGQHIPQGRFEAGPVEARRVDLDEQRTQLAHALARVRRSLPERFARRRVAVRRRALGRRGERVRNAGELLHDPVMEHPRDPPALAVGCFERLPQERLALFLPCPQASRHRPGEGQLEQPEHEQRAEQRRRERKPEMPAAVADRAEALVGLEQERLPVRGVDRHVHLEQLVLVALEPVLLFVEVGDVGVEPAGPQRVELPGPERIAVADQPRLVRVHDRAVGRPDLDAHDRVAKDPPADQGIQTPQRVRIASHGGRGDTRLDRAAAHEARYLLRLADRLRGPGTPHDRDADRAEHQDRDHAHDGEARHRPSHGGRRPAPLAPALSPLTSTGHASRQDVSWISFSRNRR